MDTRSTFVDTIRGICRQRGITCEPMSYDWIIRLSRSGKTAVIMGYHFGLNPDVTDMICRDKAALSMQLGRAGVNNVPHTLFCRPINQAWSEEEGNWPRLMALLEKDHALVCKSNTGTSGNLVFRVGSPFELEEATFRIFKSGSNMSVCPYLDIKHEYRAVVLDESVLLVYSKARDALVGDGVSSVRDLYLSHISLQASSGDALRFPDDADRIPSAGEVVLLDWKHNLGKGARAEPVLDSATISQIEELALKAANAVEAKFVSVDIVDANGELQVLEINSGVMMAHLLEQNDDLSERAKEIYANAIEKALK